MLFKAYCVVMLTFLILGLLYAIGLMIKETFIDEEVDEDWEQS